MTNLERAVKYVERKIRCEIYLVEYDGGGYYVTNEWSGGIRYACIAGNNHTILCHELGHVLCEHGCPPISPISQLLRELEAWRAAEALAYKFDIPFDDDVFGEGIDTYIYELMGGDESPSYHWLSQLFGG